MNDNIKTIFIEGMTMYTCKKCDEVSKRRYNMERHFRRFHETITPGKTCCDSLYFYKTKKIKIRQIGVTNRGHSAIRHVTFSTKSEFYKHREKIHKQKMYMKGPYQNASKTKQGITVFTKRNRYKRKTKNKKVKIYERKDYIRGQKQKTFKTESSEGTTFSITNDVCEENKENEKNHNEKKKYTKEQNQKTSKIESSADEQRETLINTQMGLLKTQNSNKNMQLLYEHLNAPKKQFLYKWQENFSRQLHTDSRRALLINMENYTSRRTAMKRASQRKIKKLNYLNLDKENVKIYNITDYSVEGIYKGLNSIIF
ncbi:hypothetical protein ALC62_00329 [Cyphomyrmex costatus]|uniref:C2H2-type domain-containing protein n=1 Tax=Cyphomyrmex costatus TaxID=456900 RepID=A0A195D709_9HYME|nr:hypothetical protein ALC62_00329 [Cyphomyrmex costatus]